MASNYQRTAVLNAATASIGAKRVQELLEEGAAGTAADLYREMLRHLTPLMNSSSSG